MNNRKSKAGARRAVAAKATPAQPSVNKPQVKATPPAFRPSEAKTPAQSVTKVATAAVAAKLPETVAPVLAVSTRIPETIKMPEPAVQAFAAVPAVVETAREIAVETIEAIETTTNSIIQEGSNIMTKTNLNETGKVAAERIQAAFGDVNERAKAAVEKGSKMLDEATELTKGNVEALVASSKIAAKGVETLGHEAADYGRRSFEEASAALKSFAEVKSPTDFFRLQGEFAKTAFDAMVAESSKMSEAVIKLAGEVAQPITNRYSVAADRVKSLAA